MIDSCIRLILDVRQTSMPLTVKAKRSDTGRKLQVTLSDGGAPYTISDDCYAVLTGKKPDSTVLYNRCSVVNNVVEYIFTEQTCAVVGRIPSEIRLYGNDGKLLTSASFVLEVHDTVFHEDDVISEDEMNAWDQLLLETVELKNEVQRKLDNGEFNGRDGTDYVLTDVDRNEIAELAAELVDIPEGGGVDFKTDHTLKLEKGILSVNTTNDMEQDNTLPITSAGVFATVGNIEALLKTI